MSNISVGTTKEMINILKKDYFKDLPMTIERLDGFLSQPIDGILYDLGLLPEEIASVKGTNMKMKYFLMLVIMRLYEMIEEHKKCKD